ncbi:MAG: integral rane protein TerC family protein [Firmicutes bacterium]|nr:integral rane protein TerC family protein [Bacillota bacterium]
MLSSVIGVNLLLSGDNALVIALASQRLPQSERRVAAMWGAAGAIGMRIILTLTAAVLLTYPYIQLVGGVLLFGLSLKLVVEENHKPMDVHSAQNLWGAVKAILMADLVMSVDNVLAIAGVAGGNIVVLLIGLGMSIPIVIWGSKLIGEIMERWPVVILFGAAFLGWTAGKMAVADPAAILYVALYPVFRWAIPSLFASLIVLIGLMQKNHNLIRRD